MCLLSSTTLADRHTGTVVTIFRSPVDGGVNIGDKGYMVQKLEWKRTDGHDRSLYFPR